MLCPADAIRIVVSSFLINDNDTRQILWIKEREGIKHTIESRGYMKSRQNLLFSLDHPLPLIPLKFGDHEHVFLRTQNTLML